MICALTDFSVRSLGTNVRTPILDPLVPRTVGAQLLGTRSTVFMCGQTALRLERRLSVHTNTGRGQLTVRAGSPLVTARVALQKAKRCRNAPEMLTGAGTYEAYPFDAVNYHRYATALSGPQPV